MYSLLYLQYKLAYRNKIDYHFPFCGKKSLVLRAKSWKHKITFPHKWNILAGQAKYWQQKRDFCLNAYIGYSVRKSPWVLFFSYCLSGYADRKWRSEEVRFFASVCLIEYADEWKPSQEVDTQSRCGYAVKKWNRSHQVDTQSESLYAVENFTRGPKVDAQSICGHTVEKWILPR